MNQKTSNSADDPRESPTAWFAALERARVTRDYELAARAQRELRRLGVKVTFSVARREGRAEP